MTLQPLVNRYLFSVPNQHLMTGFDASRSRQISKQTTRLCNVYDRASLVVDGDYQGLFLMLFLLACGVHEVVSEPLARASSTRSKLYNT